MNIYLKIFRCIKRYIIFFIYLPVNFNNLVRDMQNHNANLEQININTKHILWSMGKWDFFFSGERQVLPDRSLIRKDHLARYTYAASHLDDFNGTPRILDIACGIGYGASILSDQIPSSFIDAYDINETAIEYANTFYKRNNIDFRKGDIEKLEIQDITYDMVVSFETIEHIKDYKSLLELLARALKPGAIAFISTPNEATMPFSPESFPFHIRHFSLTQLQNILPDYGLDIVDVKSQHDRDTGLIIDNDSGIYLILMLKKAYKDI